MRLTEFSRAIARVEYKPGYEVSVEAGNHEGPHLRIYAPVIDAYTYEPTFLDIHSPLADVAAIEGLTTDQFFQWLDARLQRVALHEHAEWFKVDGKAWRDPHAEGYCLDSRAT